MNRARAFLGVVTCVLILTGCDSTSTGGSSGGDESDDCNAKLRIGDTTYVFHPEAVTSPPEPVKPVGAADVLDCDAKVVDTATAVRMSGVPVSVAVAVVEEWTGVYVAEGSEPSTWPDPLKQ